MPVITRWYIKTALLFFVSALLVRLIQAANFVWEISPIFAALGPVYFHLFLVGWVTELIFGVVHWMFPKYSQEKPRGSESLAWVTYVLLNLGLILRVIAEPVHASDPQAWAGGLLVLSAVLQLLAGFGFIANTWNRVKEK